MDKLTREEIEILNNELDLRIGDWTDTPGDNSEFIESLTKLKRVINT